MYKDILSLGRKKNMRACFCVGEQEYWAWRLWSTAVGPGSLPPRRLAGHPGLSNQGIYLSIYLYPMSIMSIKVNIYLSIYLFFYVYLSILPSFHPSTYMYKYMLIYTYINTMFTYAQPSILNVYCCMYLICDLYSWYWQTLVVFINRSSIERRKNK